MFFNKETFKIMILHKTKLCDCFYLTQKLYFGRTKLENFILNSYPRREKVSKLKFLLLFATKS